MRLDAAIIQQQIAAILRAFPDMADDEDEEAWALTLESETDLFEFLREVERRRQAATHLAGAIAGNIAELELRQERFTRREKGLRELMRKLMELADLRKCELPEATISMAKGQPKLVGGDDVGALYALPDKFVRIKRELDRAAIKSELAAGGQVPGFYLSNAEPHITIRTK
jgi:vacuolar-type H+-ATPase subunit E/Vma4